MVRITQRSIVVLIGLALVVGAFLLGRITNGPEGDRSGDYFAGLRQGESRGIQEGRALQVTEALPRDTRKAVRTAFDTGYAAGANDAFGGYDGGWYVSRPYLVTVTNAPGPITYDLSSRTLVDGGIDYYLCPHSHRICQRRHR